MAARKKKNRIGRDQCKALLEFIYTANGATPGAASDGMRFTQDWPVLPDVWIAYASNGLEGAQNLLINPFMGRRAGLVAQELRNVTEKIRCEGSDTSGQPAPVAHVPGLVAASLTFHEMLHVALPSTVWWQARTDAMVEALKGVDATTLLPSGMKKHRKMLIGWIEHGFRDGDQGTDAGDFEADRKRREFLALMRLVATMIKWAKEDGDGDDALSADEVFDTFCEAYEGWASPTRGLIWNIALNRDAKLSSRDSTLSIKADAGRRLFKISCADITWAMIDSGIDISAPAFRDWAAEKDRTKPARKTKQRVSPEIEIIESLYIERPLRMFSQDARRETMMGREEDEKGWPTRVVERYDFTDIMRLLDISTARAMRARVGIIESSLNNSVPEDATSAPSEPEFWETVSKCSRMDKTSEDPDDNEIPLSKLRAVSASKIEHMIRRIIESSCLKIGRVRRREIAEEVIEKAREGGANIRKFKEPLGRLARWRLFTEAVVGAKAQLDSLISRIDHGFELDWSILEEFLIDMTPDEPMSPHGTQVAGVLGADWREPVEGKKASELTVDDYLPKVQGVCPDIRMIDLRVSDSEGSTQEFEAIAALQFILHLNARSSEKAIHGANISLSIEHDVRNYGCGKTRICEVCEQLVASGVVVVAAAGNGGTVAYDTVGGAQYHGYQSGSITDPGNADAVITVGATHATKPHQYGVSYFSSRGPTGDGRMKPDLVAPGEKIVTGGLRQSLSVVDGTSFAAPHVSGAAALLMARHSELVGQPERVKQVLMDTATDLGRDPNFQGAGMLDTLRALQSL